MKKIISSLVIVLSVICLPGTICVAKTNSQKANPSVTTSGNMVTKTYNSPVTAIESNIVCSLIIKKSIKPVITVRAPKNRLDKTQITIANGKLMIESKEKHSSYSNSADESKFIVEVQQPAINMVEVNGVSSIECGGNFSGCNMKFKNNGVVNMNLSNLQCRTLSIEYNGVGTAIVSGVASSSQFEVNGNATINAFDFKCLDVKAEVNGVGSIECYASKTLTAEVDGIGNIYYKGKPSKVISDSKSTKIHNKSESTNVLKEKSKARFNKRTEPSKPTKKRKVLVL